jgi:hypothetical protein
MTMPGNESATIDVNLRWFFPFQVENGPQRERLHDHGLEARVLEQKCQVTSYELYVRPVRATPEARKQLERGLEPSTSSSTT